MAPGSNQDIEEHFVTLGSDLSLKCGVISPREEEVVVWKWSQGLDHKSDRVLSVGKMLVRNDGKGSKKNILSCFLTGALELLPMTMIDQLSHFMVGPNNSLGI